MSTEILEQSPLFHRWILEALFHGEGDAEAWKELMDEITGTRKALRVALLGRWRSLPAEIEARLATASLGTLYDLLFHLTTDTMEQVRARLGL